jgi:hypothetical protein
MQRVSGSAYSVKMACNGDYNASQEATARNAKRTPYLWTNFRARIFIDPKTGNLTSYVD